MSLIEKKAPVYVEFEKISQQYLSLSSDLPNILSIYYYFSLVLAENKVET